MNKLNAMILREFLIAAQAVRSSYELNGPNKVEKQLYSPIETLFQDLSDSIHNEELQAAVQCVERLCFRCVHHSEGLCFVTGEFGLVPRADLIKEFDVALNTIRRHLES